MPRATLRLLLACVLFSSWLVLLLSGLSLWGGIHLVLLAAVLLFPWNNVR